MGKKNANSSELNNKNYPHVSEVSSVLFIGLSYSLPPVRLTRINNFRRNLECTENKEQAAKDLLFQNKMQ